jgi:osmoprotectant transport system substrate-binding protein
MVDGSGAAGTVRSNVAAIVAGVAVVALGMLAVRDGVVSDAEEAWLRAANDLPGWLYPAVMPLQQLGALLLGPVVAVVAVLLRKYRLAVAACLVTLLKLVTERAVKAVVSRQRPATSIGPDIELRGDVHITGESFVSGHAALVAALAGVITPYLPGRWKVVPWVLVAAVMFGRVYVGAHNPLDVVCGAALGIAIAGAVNLLTSTGRRRPADGGGERSTRGPDQADETDRPSGISRRTWSSALTAVALVVVQGCSGEDSSSVPVSALKDDVITVGSFNFTESVVLAEVYSQALEEGGFRVHRQFDLGPREFVAPALDDGLIELLPEYAGTAAEFHSLGAAEPTDDIDATHASLRGAIASRSFVALAPAPAEDVNTFVVTAATAERLGIAKLSDLVGLSDELTFGGPAECPNRQLCLEGLEDVYGLRFEEFISLDAGGALTRQALLGGAVDVALLFTTDPLVGSADVVELTDDRGLQPAENVTPLVRVELVDRWGQALVDVIDAASAELTTSAVRELNAAAAAPDADVTALVAEWRSGASS